MKVAHLVNTTLKRLGLGLLTFCGALGGLAFFLNNVDANNPTYLLSSSSGCSSTREISGNVGDNKTLYICIDGNNEGAGFYGGEIAISYDTKLLSVTSVSCRNFDSCSNLSEPGRVRLLGASGAAPEGNAVTGREVLGTISFNLKQAGNASFTYTLAKIIDERQGVQFRSGIGTRVNITEPTPPPAPAAEPTPPAASTPDPSPIPNPTPTPLPSNETPASTLTAVPLSKPAGLKGLVTSPLKQKAQPGQTVQLISRATYLEGRADENVTSCFPCPTRGNPSAEGQIKYKIKGPASVYGNRVTINRNAQAGQIIQVSATYNDFKSGTTTSSRIRTITVTSPAVSGPTDLAGPPRSGCDATGAGCPPSDGGGSGGNNDCDPATGDCGNNGGGSGGEEECDPNKQDCGPQGGEPECVGEGCNPPPAEEPCDPNKQYCGPGNEPKCDPETQNCGQKEVPQPECDPNQQDCGPQEQPECDPQKEICDKKEVPQPECDPNQQDCGPQEQPECDPIHENCGPKEQPQCPNGNCTPPEKEEHELICHVLNPEKDKFIGALIYLPQDEADKHLQDHEDDYLVSDIDKNPNNDSEDCLGIDICEYKQAKGILKEVNQCKQEELISLTEKTLFPAAPQDPCENCSKLVAPTKPSNEFCAANFASDVDADQDGLSDRSECLLNTDPKKADSDNDTCWDGDEVNLFQTNPLIQTDCSLSKVAYGSVVITDPKANWIVKALDISGIAPKTTLDVAITAFPASHKVLMPIFEGFDQLVNQLQMVLDPKDTVAQEKRNSEITRLIEQLKKDLQTFYEFAKQSGGYEKELSVLKGLETYLQKPLDEIKADFSQAEALKRSLQTIKAGGTFLGLVDQLKEVAVGKETMAGFNLVPKIALPDGVYDLVAVARLKNKTLTSKPVRITLDGQAVVEAPKPQALDNIKLTPDQIKQGWELASEVKLSNLEVKTKNGRPVLTGQATYGAQIFAQWESITLASSIIVDSSEGVFEIQAPRELEKNQDHKVTLYAVIENEKGKVRSDTVSLDFHVAGTNYLLWGLVAFFFVLGAALLARHRMRKIDALPPEHRAKENELYHAFGEKERPTPLPENHDTKAAEVNSAFKN